MIYPKQTKFSPAQIVYHKLETKQSWALFSSHPKHSLSTCISTAFISSVHKLKTTNSIFNHTKDIKFSYKIHGKIMFDDKKISAELSLHQLSYEKHSYSLRRSNLSIMFNARSASDLREYKILRTTGWETRIHSLQENKCEKTAGALCASTAWSPHESISSPLRKTKRTRNYCI